MVEFKIGCKKDSYELRVAVPDDSFENWATNTRYVFDMSREEAMELFLAIGQILGVEAIVPVKLES